MPTFDSEGKVFIQYNFGFLNLRFTTTYRNGMGWKEMKDTGYNEYLPVGSEGLLT